MESVSHINLLKLFAFFIICFCICSCSQSFAKMESCDFKVIYSYKDSDSFPEARLSIYSTFSSDSRLLSEMEVVTEKSKYNWKINELTKLNMNNTYYAGYSNIFMPEGVKIPEEVFEITYTAYNGEQAEIKYNLKYDTSIYDKKTQELNSYEQDGLVKKIVIYNENEEIISYNEKTDEGINPEELKKMYPSASFYNEVWLLSSGKEIIILPEIKIN